MPTPVAAFAIGDKLRIVPITLKEASAFVEAHNFWLEHCMGQKKPGLLPLGVRLRHLRENYRSGPLTLRALEAKTGISNAYLSQLETGSVENPSIRMIRKLADFYDVPVDVLTVA